VIVGEKRASVSAEGTTEGEVSGSTGRGRGRGRESAWLEVLLWSAECSCKADRGQGRAGQGRAGQGRAGQGRAGQASLLGVMGIGDVGGREESPVRAAEWGFAPFATSSMPARCQPDCRG